MPVVTVHVDKETGVKSKPYLVAFPRRVDGAWHWDEVRVTRSALDEDGFGLHTQSTEQLDWSALHAPLLLPFLGRQTELSSPVEVSVMSRILHGSFDVIPFGSLNTPQGHRWEHNGCFLESVPQGAKRGLGPEPATACPTPKRPRGPEEASEMQLADLSAYGRADRSLPLPFDFVAAYGADVDGGPEAPSEPPQWRVGDRVEAHFGEDSDELWWPGVVEAVDASGRVDVLYDDGEREARKPRGRVRRPRCGAAAALPSSGAAALPAEAPIVQVPLPEGCVAGEVRAARSGAALASDVREGEYIQLRRDVAAVVYLPKAAALDLLHIPPHVFALLQAHTDHEHVDRHFGTHVMHYRQAAQRHVLVNAHPIYREPAYAMGCINEPHPATPPTMEARQLKVTLADPRRQPAGAAAQWREFVAAFPQVLERCCFFVTLQRSYAEGAELTGTYASGYLRTYDTWGLPGTPDTARIAPDAFDAELRATRRWPERVPAWWNPAMQPRRRRAFDAAPHGGGVVLRPDARRLVAARRLLSRWGIGTHQPPRPPPKRSILVRCQGCPPLRSRQPVEAGSPSRARGVGAPPGPAPYEFDAWVDYDAG